MVAYQCDNHVKWHAPRRCFFCTMRQNRRRCTNRSMNATKPPTAPKALAVCGKIVETLEGRCTPVPLKRSRLPLPTLRLSCNRLSGIRASRTCFSGSLNSNSSNSQLAEAGVVIAASRGAAFFRVAYLRLVFYGDVFCKFVFSKPEFLRFRCFRCDFCRPVVMKSAKNRFTQACLTSGRLHTRFDSRYQPRP